VATLLQITHLNKAYGPRALFRDAGVTIGEKQKIGVIGRNGAGKSTLLRMIVGTDTPDSGEVVIHTPTRLSYLDQYDQFLPTETVLAFLERVTGKQSWECAKAAMRFRIDKAMLEAPMGSLSGGYQMRAKLTAMIATDPNLIILDEPTNYLDLSTLLLLERFLQSYHGSCLVVSHDREFLKNTCTETLEVDQGVIELYPGNVEEYLAYKEEQQLMKERYNKKIDREQKHLQAFIDRFRYKASKASQAQSKMKQLAHLEKIEIVSAMRTARFVIPSGEKRKGLALRTKEMTIGYGEKKVAERITCDIECGERVAILGDNGQGKTTLLKTITGELQVLEGGFKWGHKLSIGYYAQHIPNQLPPMETVFSYLKSQAYDTPDEELLAMAGSFLFSDDDVLKKIEMLSGGERARLSLAGILLNKHNVLLLDEPTNHLDFETVEALGRALGEYTGTLFFISHNRTFVNMVATSLLVVGGGRAVRYPGTYEEYVYTMEKALEASGIASEEAVGVDEMAHPTPAKLDYLETKTLKKKMGSVEKALVDKEGERRKLLVKLEKDPTAFSPGQYRALGSLTKEIEDLEAEWLVLQERL
jgi:ATP-binding cassette subfamily F protein 3